MAISENKEYLFVYGTLMKQYAKNQFANELEKYATFKTEAFACGKLFLIDYYPGLVKSNGFEFVYGELFEISDASLLFPKLDAYEEYFAETPDTSEYIREKVTVFTTIQNPPVSAWAYVFNRSTNMYLQIKSGKFMDTF